MPVTINGSGSITGLTQGGIDGTKVLTSAAQPAGAILQVKQAESSSQITQTTSTDFDIVTVSFTPTAVGNKIFVFGCVMGIQNGSGNNNTRFLCRVNSDVGGITCFLETKINNASDC